MQSYRRESRSRLGQPSSPSGPGPGTKAKRPWADNYDIFMNARKLDVALRRDITDAFRRYVDRRPPGGYTDRKDVNMRYELLLRSQGIPDISSCKTSTQFLPSIILDVLRDDIEGNLGRAKVERVRRVQQVVAENLKIQMDYNLDSMSEEAKKGFLKNIRETIDECRTVPSEVQRLTHAYFEFKAMVDQIPYGAIPRTMYLDSSVESRVEAILSSRSNYYSWSGLNLQVWWGGDVCIIEKSGISYLLPVPVMAEIWNKVADHISVLLFAFHAQGTYLEEGAYRITLRFLIALHQWHIVNPDSYFEMASSLEAFCNGVLITRHDSWGKDPNDEFYHAVLDEVNAAARALNAPVRDDPGGILRILESCSTPLVAELAGLSKMSGHPLISPLASMEKLHGRTTKPRTVQVAAVAWTTQSLKAMFLMEYFTENGEYPPGMVVPDNCHPTIAACLRTGRQLTAKLIHEAGLTVEDFTCLEIPQADGLDLLENMLPHLKDKAQSLVRSRVWETYIEKHGRLLKEDKINQNLLLMFLLGDQDAVDHVTFVKEFADYEKPILDFMEFLAMRLVAKEKEMKNYAARMFGCQTYKMRGATQVVLNYMQKFLRRYCPQQAMVVTELELTTKLAAFAKKKTMGAGMRAFTISIDAKAWNNAFTKETVGPPIREVVDKLVGSGLISRVHEAFEHTLFYAREAGRTVFYEGQNGGIEGLLQHVWMLVYVHQIRYALRDCAYHYDVIVKGDDVRIRFEIPCPAIDDREREVMEGLRQDLKVGLEEFGHEIKTQESYYSEEVMAFSKKIYVSGVALTSSYRQIQKVYGANNSFIFTTCDNIGAAFSNAHSAAGYGSNWVAPYIVALYWSMVHISSEVEFSKLTEDELVGLTLVPSALGGFPIIYLHNMYVRAESDLVSAFCGLLLYLRKSRPRLYALLKRVANFEKSYTTSVALLVEDPYALNRKAHTSPHATLRNRLTQLLSRHVRNPIAKALFDSEVKKLKVEFMKTMESAQLYDPKLMNSVYDCTMSAIQERFLQKFESAKSVLEGIYSMTTSHKMMRQLTETLIRERRMRNEEIAAVITVFSGRRVDVDADYFNCPTVLTEALRNVGWEKEVEGITYPPPQHQTRIIADHETTREHIGSSFVCDVVPGKPISRYMDRPQFWKTDHEPFLGHFTPSGTLAAQIDMEANDAVASSIAKLLMLSTMACLEPQDDKRHDEVTMEDVIFEILHHYTGIPVDQLAVFTHRRKSGTRCHHLAARNFRVSILPNMVSNALSHVKYTVDTNRELRVTPDNFRINFLQLMVHHSVLVLMGWSFKKFQLKEARFKALIPRCEECYVPIRERNMYMLSKGFFGLNPVTNDIFRKMVDRVEDLMKVALHEEASTRDLRTIRGGREPTSEDACWVVTQDFFTHVINTYTAIAGGYSVFRPTPERMSTVMDLKGRSKKGRNITGSDLSKIPGSVLAVCLREVVAEYTYQYLDPENTMGILVAYALRDPKTLPWATCLYQLSRHARLGSLIRAVNSMCGRPYSDGANCLRSYGEASRYVGTLLALEGMKSQPHDQYLMVLSTVEMSPTIHNMLQRRRLARLLWLVEEHPLSFGDFHPEDGWLVETWPVYSVLALATFPHYSVEAVRSMFSETEAERYVTLFDPDIRDEWFHHESFWEQRMSPDCRYVLRRWFEASGGEWADLLEYLRFEFLDAYRTCHLEGLALNVHVKVVFLDLSDCYSAVRARPMEADMDDYVTRDEAMKATDVLPIPWDRIQPESVHGLWVFDDPSADLGPIREDVLREYEEPLMIDFTYVGRPLGDTTSSWYKVASILTKVGAVRLWATRRFNAACLADGDGGDSRWIVDTFPKAQVYWNSLNTNLTEKMHTPPSCRVWDDRAGVYVHHPRVHCFEQMLDGGDLTKEHIRDLVKQGPSVYHLVKHDCSLPHDASRAAVAAVIWGGVLDIWRTSSSPTGVMIQKVFLDIPVTVAWLLYWARRSALRCFLVILNESHCNMEAHVVCIGLKENPGTICWDMRSDATSRAIVEEASLRALQTMRECSLGVSAKEIALLTAERFDIDTESPSLASQTLAWLALNPGDYSSIRGLLRDLEAYRESHARGVQRTFMEMATECSTQDTLEHLKFKTADAIRITAIVRTVATLVGVAEGRMIPTVFHKRAILDECNDELQSWTDTPRWQGVGGPFTLEDEVVEIPVGASRLRPVVHRLPFRNAVRAGIREGLTIIGHYRRLTIARRVGQTP